MPDLLSNVAIIGAGLGGCALAIALSDRGIPLTIFESRSEDAPVTIPSGILLTPNGLKVLDYLGIYQRIKDRCYVSHRRVYINDNDEITSSTDTGEYDGFRVHRVWRRILLNEMRAMLHERNVPIHHGSKFSGIVSETAEGGVEFLIGQRIEHASLLVGSDGIYSTVRNHISPEISPVYTGDVAILAHIRRESVSWPYPDYDLNATIQSKPGGLIFIPEDPEAVDLLVGKQIHYPEQSRQDLDALQKNKDKLASLFRESYEEYGSTARKLIDRVCDSKESMFIWPLLKMPGLPRWYSDTGRIIIIGDGAHAIPPSSGQGVNQALEDVYSLTLTLMAMKGWQRNDLLKSALAHWQGVRQEKIQKVLDWTFGSMNVGRLPEAERRKLIEEGRVKQGEWDDMSWLYDMTGVKERIGAWAAEHQGQ